MNWRKLEESCSVIRVVLKLVCKLEQGAVIGQLMAIQDTVAYSWEPKNVPYIAEETLLMCLGS